MKTGHSTMWKWCAGFALVAGLFVAAPQVQADVYLGRDGGLEGAATVDDTVQTTAQAGKWTKNNATQNIAEETTVVRSGGKSIRMVNSATTARRTWTPLLTFGSKTTAVTIQYYRLITNSTSYQTNQVGVLRASESLQGTYNAPASINTWEKKTYSPASATFTSIAGVIMHRAATTGAGSMFVDDLCFYDGAADTTAPNSAGTVTLTTNSTTELALSWDAASGGVDSGGYLVVRYASEPAADDDPNVNGIYATNNTLVGSVTGTVVYQGDGTTYTDSGLTTDQTYYYKVYSYDKAYNYAAESTASGTPTGESTSAPSVTTVAAGSIAATTATANGDVTDDGGDTVTERGVVYKTSADVAITDNPTAAAAGGTGEFSVDLSSLSVNQIYYFRAYAINGVDTTLAANELNFTTLANVPSAPTVNNPTATTLDIAVNENGNPASTEFAIQRTSDSLYLQADGSFGAAAVWATKAAWGTKTATGLASETEYFFQVKARNGANVETAFGSTASGTTAAPPTGIWINPMSAGTPMATYYLGDVLGEWFVNFEIGQTWWDYAQLGIGTSAEGTGYNWGEAIWYQDGEGENKRVRRNLIGYQFTSAANHYVICQAKAYSGDGYTSKSGNGWGNLLAYPPADLASAYFAVSALNDPSGQSATADQSTQINLFWSNNAQSHDVMVVRKLAAASWTEPTQGTSYSASDTLGAGTVVYKGDSGVFYDTGLSADTTYDYKFYSVNNDYYSAGVTAQETTLTCEPDAPVGLGAVADYTSFTASWDATDRATGYRLDVSTETEFQTSGNGELIISEVADPLDVANAKFIELYNGTGAAIDFSAATWYLARQANGGSWANTQLTGVIPAGGTYVVAYNQTSYETAFGTAADQYSGNISGNGDDGYFLVQGGGYTTGTVVDAYGVIDQDGTGFAWEYLDKNAVRNANIAAPNATWTASEWTIPGTTVNTADMDPDAHTCTGDTAPSFVAGFENLAVAGTSQSVTGLTEGATYYFRVRAEGEGGCPSVNSTTASTTTREHLRAVITPETVNVREGGEGRFFVRLNQDPGGVVEVAVSHSSGDAGIAIQGATTTLTFRSSSWSAWQAVTLTAPEDENSASETATFLVALAGAADVFAEAATLDDEIGDNLASAAVGATLTAWRGYRLSHLIDGVHAVSTNYAFTTWTSVPPGTITLDLQATTVVSRVRILTWDWNYRNHRYTIESSLNGSSWSTLVDASTGEHRGWEDWTIGDAQARYLRFTGLTNSVNAGFCVPELEVYGARLQTPALEFSTDNVLVREAGEGRLFVRMTEAPEGNLAVNVDLAAGDADVALQGPTTLTFKPSNWTTWQGVTLTAGADGNAVNETGSLRISMVGAADQFVDLEVLDVDIGENVALAAGGASMTAWRGYRLADAIDGVHATMTNYAFTTYTSVPPGRITLDMQTAMTVSRVRILTWDWDYRDHRYTIESSTDGSTWSMLADASAGAHRGWEDWAVADAQIRYLRFTGLTNSVNPGVCVPELEVYGTRPLPELIQLSKTSVNVREGGEGRFFVRLASAPAANVVISVARTAGDASLTIQGGASLTFKPSNWSTWQKVTLAQVADANADGETATLEVSMPGVLPRTVTATALDDEIGENLALASAGATLTGRKAYYLPYVIDGVHTALNQYGYTIWTNVPPGTMTLDLGSAAIVSRVRLLNWDWTYRTHQYLIESSTDGETWSTLADASMGAHHGWEDWAAGGETIRYLRFTGLANSANTAVCLSELEVIGTRVVGRRALKGAAAIAESEPVAVLTSGGAEDETGWNAVDGDDATAWVGQQAGGGYLVVEYAPTLTLSGLEVDVAEGSLADVQVLTSLNAKEWQPLPEDLEKNPVSLNFLWLVFPDDGAAAVPEVIEIRPNP